MKKQWKSALFAVLLSTVLFSCGSGEPKKEKEENSEAFKESSIHYDKFLKKKDSIQPLFDDPDFEPYHKALIRIYEWDRLWQIEFHKKYPDFENTKHITY